MKPDASMSLLIGSHTHAAVDLFHKNIKAAVTATALSDAYVSSGLVGLLVVASELAPERMARDCPISSLFE